MNLEELRNLDLRDVDFRNFADWPLLGRGLILAVLFVVIFAIGYFLVVREQVQELNAARQQEVELKHTVAAKQHLVADLGAYQRQLATMKETFAKLLQKLPSQTEIDHLLRDISQTAQEDGLTQKLFQPGAENRKAFYAEKPIAMDYVGSYQQVAKFVSDVAALPRIVTFRDFSLAPMKSGEGSELDFTVTAVTYRYLTASEAAGTNGKKARRRRGRRR